MTLLSIADAYTHVSTRYSSSASIYVRTLPLGISKFPVCGFELFKIVSTPPFESGALTYIHRGTDRCELCEIKYLSWSINFDLQYGLRAIV